MGTILPDGIPSPSPDYPQQIKNVTGNANVKIQNKNLFDGTRTNIYFNSSGNFVSYTNAITTQYISAKEADKFIVSCSSNSEGLVIASFDINKNLLERSATRGTSLTYTCPQGTAYIISSNVNGMINNTQLEQGSTATSYVEHQEQNYPFTLGDIELCKIDTAQDYFYKENNKWYLHKEIRKRTISSVSELGTASSGIKYAGIGSVPNVLSNSYVYCDNYINSSDATKNNSIRVAGVNLFVYDNRFTNVETAQSLLNGLEYYYIMETPTDTEITDTTLINQLEATLQARSYDDITYITSTSDELGFDMKVIAVADANKVINSLDTRLLALESEV